MSSAAAAAVVVEAAGNVVTGAPSLMAPRPPLGASSPWEAAPPGAAACVVKGSAGEPIPALGLRIGGVCRPVWPKMDGVRAEAPLKRRLIRCPPAPETERRLPEEGTRKEEGRPLLVSETPSWAREKRREEDERPATWPEGESCSEEVEARGWRAGVKGWRVPSSGSS